MSRAIPSGRAADASHSSQQVVSTTGGIPIAIDVNLTDIMRREGIAKIEDYVTRFSVVLKDGRFGVAPTVGEALVKAKKPDAENIRRLSA